MLSASGARIAQLLSPQKVALAVVRAVVLLFGFKILLGLVVDAQGGAGTIWRFGHDDRHRVTAMAMLTGTLRLRNTVLGVSPDEQVYNGGVYTNWGFGVPLLQLPFHAAAPRFSFSRGGFFPDRAIFLIYVAAAIPVLWLALRRLVAVRGAGRFGQLRDDVVSSVAVAFVLTVGLFPLMSARFLVYEETVAYFVLCEMFALAAYIFSLECSKEWPLVALGIAAGMGLLVRLTGLVYLAMWGGLIVLERQRRRSMLVYAASAAPFVVFWLYSNWAKAGGLFSFGYQNSMPWGAADLPGMRFGTVRCANTAKHAWQVLWQLFRWCFLTTADDKERPQFLNQCQLGDELRPGSGHEAFLGVPVLAFLVWTLAHHVARRERRLAIYVPFATLAFLFANYARSTLFAWRYAGDFTVILFLIGVHYARRRRLGGAGRSLAVPLALCMAVFGWGTFRNTVTPSLSSLQMVGVESEGSLRAAFEKMRYGRGGVLSSRVECGRVPELPYQNGRGWKKDCTVDTVTNFFLGVPKSNPGGAYDVRLETTDLEAGELRLYFNGKLYPCSRSSDGYVAHVHLDYAALHEPIVMGTIEWTPGLDPKPGKLLAIEIR